MKPPIHPATRRKFVKVTAALTTGLVGLPLLPAVGCNMASAEEGPNIIGPRTGYSPQVGTLVSMLDWMRGVVLNSVQGLTVAELDYVHDANANSIGAMLLHLAAIERYYQLDTFEGRKWANRDEPTKKQWDTPLELGPEARQKIKGKSIDYYLSTLKAVRNTSLRELQQRDDTWLMTVDRTWPWGPTNNYCKWFHVCEHESNHNGQIKWIKGRLPTAKKAND
jgi:uncharacterized damage-inducible protein DinB